jgi:hypothetical protein
MFLRTVLKEAKRLSTYIFPDNRAEASNPHDANPANLEHEQTFARKYRLSNALSFKIFSYTLRASQKGVFPNIPFLLARKADVRYISQHRWSEKHFSRSGVCRVRYAPAGNEFLQRDLNVAFECDVWRHGDHGT